MTDSELVCVPRSPTPEMLKEAWADALGEDALGVWNSMIEASPDHDFLSHFCDAETLDLIEWSLQISGYFCYSPKSAVRGLAEDILKTIWSRQKL